MALPIIAMNPMKGSVLIDFSDIFMTDFAQLNLGMIDRSRSNWSKVKGFHDNMELELETTFASGGRRGGYGGTDGVADHRGITVVIHYSLMKTPDFGYRPRTADDRVGHFLSATKDFGSHRRRFELRSHDQSLAAREGKSLGQALAAPQADRLVCRRHRSDRIPPLRRGRHSRVEQGIREDRFQGCDRRSLGRVGRDDFDPEDTHYCTFRWVTNDCGGAMSCLRANPLTGEMIDGDVVFDAGFIRYWKQQYALLVGHTTGAGGERQTAPLAIGEVVSPILASKMGYGLPQSNMLLGIDALGKNPAAMMPELRPADQDSFAWEVTRNFDARHPRFLPVP